MSPSRWLVPVVALRRSTGAQREEHRSGPLGELQVAGSLVEGTDDVDVDVLLTAVAGGVEVAGTVAATWAGTCRRCLRPVGGRLEVAVRELYTPHEEQRAPSPGRSAATSGPGRGDAAGGRPGAARPGGTHPAGGEGEVDEETYPLGPDHLDLEPLARDALLLALPLAPLCRDDCAGLCPTCGADLAGGDCGCVEAVADPRWAALDILREADGGVAD